MQLVQLDMKQISSEAEIYDCLVGQMNFTNADEKPEWMNVIEMNERDPYEMDTEEQPEDPEFKKILETPEKTLDGLVQMLAARLADDYCLEVIRDEAADDEKKKLEKRLERALEDAARTIDERDGKLYAILEDTNPGILRYLRAGRRMFHVRWFGLPGRRSPSRSRRKDAWYSGFRGGLRCRLRCGSPRSTATGLKSIIKKRWNARGTGKHMERKKSEISQKSCARCSCTGLLYMRRAWA